MTAIEVYRDDACYATINDEPSTLGHIRIYPHSQIECLENMKSTEVLHLFKVASICSSMLYEGMKAQGTNIICHNGKGQHPLCIEVLARFNEDNLGLMWEPTQGNPAEITTTANMIKDKIIPVDVEPSRPIVQESPDEISEVEGKVNLRIEQLRRIP
jgi:diadenosine tetraphosphate (Ap4A) HIT family hydrolase